MHKKIKSKAKKLLQKIKDNKIKSGILFIILIFILKSFGGSNGEEIYITENPALDSLEQLVSVSGTVEANQKIDLRFQSSGKVSVLNFEIGDTVNSDSLIAELDNDIQQNSINSALAQLSIANADLNLAYAGPTLEEAQLALIRIEEAELNYLNSQNNYDKILSSNDESLKVAELQYDTAFEAFENAGYQLENTESTLENTLETADQKLTDAYDAADEVIKDTLVSLDNSLEILRDYSDISNEIHSALINFSEEYEGLTGESLDIIEDINFTRNLGLLEDSLNNIQLTYTIEQQDLTEERRSEILNEIKTIINDLVFNANLINEALANLKEEEEQLDSDLQAYKALVETEITNLNTISTTLDTTIQTIQDAEFSLEASELSQGGGNETADLDYITKKNNLDIAESNLTTVTTQNEINLNNAQLDVDLKEIYVNQAQTNYDQLIAEPRAVDVASLRARVSQYNSNYERALIQLEDTKIYAPTDGIITDVDMQVGENISSAENVVTIINDELQILANISETEVAKLKIGDPIRLTFDAFSVDKEYTGKVIKIDPAETVIQGVIYYQTTILFDEYDETVKSGMTVNLDIITASVDETLQIPIQALNYDDDKVYVYILEGDEKIRQFIETGIEGDYNIEVLEGVSLNDNVIIYEKT